MPFDNISTELKSRLEYLQGLKIRKYGNELFNSLKRKTCQKFSPLAKHVDLTERRMMFAGFEWIILYVFYLLFVSTLLGVGIWKIRSFRNKLEVIFRRQFGVGKHSYFLKSRAIILVSK